MRNGKQRFTGSGEYNEKTIQKVFRVEYFTYDRIKIITRACIGFALIAMTVFLQLSTLFVVACLAVGCWLIVCIDFPSKVKAEGVLQARNGAVTTVNLQFGENAVKVVEGKQSYKYSAIDRLVTDGDYLFLFCDRQTAVMLDRRTLEPADERAFKQFIEEKTGKKWKGTSLLLMNFQDLRQAMKDRKKQ